MAEVGRRTANALDHPMTAFGEQKISECLVDYTGDSVLTSNSGTVCGYDEIQARWDQQFEEFSLEGVEMTVKTQDVEGKIGDMVWHAKTPTPSTSSGPTRESSVMASSRARRTQ